MHTPPGSGATTPRRHFATPEHLTVLLVEDNPGDAALVRRALPATYEVVGAATLAAATMRRERGGIDAVLLDLSLPDGAFPETIAWSAATSKRTPVIVLTGLDDDEVAVQTLRAGVQDYLAKDRIDADTLAHTIRYAIERQRLLHELEDLRQRQLEAKDQLLSNVSHELRTPLNAVYQFLTIVLDEIAGPLSSEQREYLGIAHRSAEQLRAMIGDLLDATRLEGGTIAIEPVPSSLREAVTECLAGFMADARARNVTVQADVAADLPLLLFDPLRLRQVLANLVHNALKFTAADGAIAIVAARDPEEAGTVRVSVADTGCGIAPDALEQIFERFQQAEVTPTTSRKGLGLGLYICRELVTRQGGRIWVESRPGAGARFHFTLPVAPAEDGQSRTSTPRA